MCGHHHICDPICFQNQALQLHKELKLIVEDPGSWLAASQNEEVHLEGLRVILNGKCKMHDGVWSMTDMF
jgi:hypothetical protein